MAKKTTSNLRPLEFVGDPDGQTNGTPHWQAVWCAEHHFETLERRLIRCPYGCPPGPSVRTLQSEVVETLGGGSRGGMKTETGRGFLMKGNVGDPTDHPIGKSGQPEHVIVGTGSQAYCPICVNISYISHPRYRALILRENEKDLADFISRARSLYEPMGANVTEKPARVTFPSPFDVRSPGAAFILGHMKDTDAFSDYQGQEYQRMLFEELTQIAQELLYLKIIGSCRSTFTCRKGCKKYQCRCGALRRQILNTANPGGKGHLWVKKRFISVGPPNVPYTDPLTKQTRVYIPSTVTDNPYLMQDEGYLAWLEGLPEPTRSAWRFGDWDALGGQYFRDFRPKGPLAGEPVEARHVIPAGSHPLQPWWTRWLGADWGYGHGYAVYGACQDPNGQIVVYRELCGNETGAIELGDRIARAFLPDIDMMSRANIAPAMNFWLSPDAFDKRDAVLTIAESIGAGIQRVLGPGSVHFPDLRDPQAQPTEKWDDRRFEEVEIQQKAGINIRRAQNSRIAGWQYMRELLRFRQIAQPNRENYNPEYHAHLMLENSARALEYVKSFELRKPEILPKVLFTDDCPGIIEAIPVAIHEEGTEDVLKTETPEDDRLDGARYCLHSQNQAKVRKPKQSFIQEHIERYSTRQSMSFNDKVWMAQAAAAEYAKDDIDMTPFRVRPDSARWQQ